MVFHRECVTQVDIFAPTALQSRTQSFGPLDQRSENESSGSIHFQITMEITEFCISGFTAQCPPDLWLWERDWLPCILVPRGRDPFGQHWKSRPLGRSNSGSPRFTDFPLLCACSESSQTNLIGSGLNLLCSQGHSKPECRWTWPEVVIFSADQKDRGLWGREWTALPTGSLVTHAQSFFSSLGAQKLHFYWAKLKFTSFMGSNSLKHGAIL